MSYTPTLIILKKDLDKHKELFQNGLWKHGADVKDAATRPFEEGMTVMEFIYSNAYTKKPITIGGIEIVLCTTEFSSSNEVLRQKLKELNIEFAVSY